MKIVLDYFRSYCYSLTMMSNANKDNPNSKLDPQDELRDMIQILPEEAIGWPGDGSGIDDLADFQANNWDGE